MLAGDVGVAVERRRSPCLKFGQVVILPLSCTVECWSSRCLRDDVMILSWLDR